MHCRAAEQALWLAGAKCWSLGRSHPSEHQESNEQHKGSDTKIPDADELKAAECDR
jgi:hypothetical protein|tara:strand:+ start:318 stop:485 length:168 start_codon:yes stop_codon:yes gene_type:complete